MHYRERTPIVTAIQWKGDNLGAVIDLIGLHPSAHKWTWKKYEEIVQKDGLKVFARDGSVIVPVGYWIIKDEDGDLSIRGNDVFERAYEPILVLGGKNARPSRNPGTNG